MIQSQHGPFQRLPLGRREGLHLLTYGTNKSGGCCTRAFPVYPATYGALRVSSLRRQALFSRFAKRLKKGP